MTGPNPNEKGIWIHCLIGNSIVDIHFLEGSA